LRIFRDPKTSRISYSKLFLGKIHPKAFFPRTARSSAQRTIHSFSPSQLNLTCLELPFKELSFQTWHGLRWATLSKSLFRGD